MRSSLYRHRFVVKSGGLWALLAILMSASSLSFAQSTLVDFEEIDGAFPEGYPPVGDLYVDQGLFMEMGQAANNFTPGPWMIGPWAEEHSYNGFVNKAMCPARAASFQDCGWGMYLRFVEPGNAQSTGLATNVSIDVLFMHEPNSVVVSWLDADDNVIASQSNQNFIGYDENCMGACDEPDCSDGDETFTAPFPVSGVWISQVSTPSQCQGSETYWIDNINFEAIDTSLQERRDLDCPPEGAAFGNPCDAATGNKYQREIDLDASEIDLSIVRHYASASGRDVGFGIGWTTRYHKRLEFDGQAIRAYTDTGSSEGFIQINGAWTGPLNGRLQLTQDASGFMVTFKTGDYDRFDLAGRLVSEHRRGKVTSYSYDGTGKLQTVTGPYGHALMFTYNAFNRVDTITDTGGRFIQYGYDGIGNLTTVTYPDSTSRTYQYEDPAYPGALTGVTDERGIRYATFGYDSAGRVKLTQHAVTDNGSPQESFSLTYDSEQQTTIVDARGITTVLTFEENLGSKNLLTSANLNDGKTEVRVFDSHNNRSEYTDGEGRKTRFVYTSDNQLRQTRHVHGIEEEDFTIFFYESPSRDLVRLIEDRNAAGGQLHRVRIAYDQNLNIDTIAEEGYDAAVNPLTPRVADYDFDSQGRLTRIDGFRTDVSDVTQFAYYECAIGGECGMLQSVTNALGHVTEFSSYDPYGRVETLVYPNGVVSQYVYDLRGRVLSISETPPAGLARTTSFTYTPSGLVETATSPENSALSYTYDDANDLRVIQDSLGNEIRRDYDLAGNVVNETVHDPAGVLQKQIQAGYDARNQLASLTELAQMTLFLHDASGNLESITDANSNFTSHQINNLNRITETVDALNGSTTFGYDAAWNLSQVTAPNGASTGFVYDDFGNLLEESSPDRGTLQHIYDAAGNRISTADGNGAVVNYSYDALNRLISVEYPDEPAANIVYQYDEDNEGQNGIGRLTGTNTTTITTNHFYDFFGNVVRQRYELSGLVLDTLFTYDRDDYLSSVTYPSGRIVNYDRDQAGNIIAVESQTDATSLAIPLATGIAYKPFGPPAGLTFGNEHTTVMSYDEAYRTATIDTALGGAAIQDWTYGRDPVGNITNWSDDAVTSRSQLLGYDALHRLDTGQSEYGALDFDYDPNGNRNVKLEGTNNTTYSYAPATNRLLGIDDGTTSWNLAYDGAVNIISKLDATGAGWLYGYSARNRLATVSTREIIPSSKGGKPPTVKDTVVGTYEYDAFGQQVSATRDGQTAIYTYGLNGALLAEVDSELSHYRDYVYLDARPIAVQDLEVVVGNTPPLVEIVVDNGAAGASSTGTWSTLTNQNDFGANYLLASGGSGSTHTWSPTLTAGEYQVYAWWVSKAQYSQNVPYVINHAGLQAAVPVNQSSGGGQWNLLGTYTFDGSTSENIVVSDSGGKTTADAVKFVQVVTPTVQTTETTHFVHSDHIATPRAVTDLSGELVWSWFSTPFGNLLPDADADGDGTDFELNLRFAGQYYQAESGLHYNYFRTYDPATGRYLESDPIGLAGGMNSYAYSSGNPLTNSDPLGLFDIFIGGLRDRIVRQYEAAFPQRYPSRNSEYFEWGDQDEIVQAVIDRLKISPCEPINLIGHSYGGATAANVAEVLSGKGIGTTVVTVDPVSRPWSHSNVGGAHNWINILATNEAPGGGWGNFIGWAGGKWGDWPQGRADQHYTAPYNHADFSSILNHPSPNGKSALQTILEPNDQSSMCRCQP